MVEALSLCGNAGATFLFFSPDVPELIYYTHVSALLLTISLLAIISFRGKYTTEKFILLLSMLPFWLWLIANIVIWASNRPDIIMFLWSVQIIIEPLVYFGFLYLTYFVTLRRSVPPRMLMLWIVLYLPIVFVGPTQYNLWGFDLAECIPIESFYAYWTYIIEIIYTCALAYIAVHAYRITAERERRGQILYFTSGAVLFLLTFASGNIIGSFTGDWVTAQAGLFGVPIFVALSLYSIVQYRTFNIKLFGVSALTFGLFMLSLALVLLRDIHTFRVVALTTAILVGIFGIFLVRSVSREIENREKGEQLARYLANANARLRELDRQKTEFVSIASHQLRAPIAAITGYASLLAEGSYGPVPDTIKEPLMRVFESGKRISIMVDDFLNVTRMEQGRMTYAHLPVDMCKLVQGAVSEVDLIAKNRGLSLEAHTPEGAVQVMGDEGKLKQVLSNLIDNAVKYTKAGFVRVALEVTETQRSVIITIADSGIGIAPEELPRLFTKFNRASNANSATVSGTGLGLYIAKEIVKAHNGWLHVSSPGLDKGSVFTIELPLSGQPAAAGSLQKSAVLVSK